MLTSPVFYTLLQKQRGGGGKRAERGWKGGKLQKEGRRPEVLRFSIRSLPRVQQKTRRGDGGDVQLSYRKKHIIERIRRATRISLSLFSSFVSFFFSLSHIYTYTLSLFLSLSLRCHARSRKSIKMLRAERVIKVVRRPPRSSLGVA